MQILCYTKDQNKFTCFKKFPRHSFQLRGQHCVCNHLQELPSGLCSNQPVEQVTIKFDGDGKETSINNSSLIQHFLQAKESKISTKPRTLIIPLITHAFCESNSICL